MKVINRFIFRARQSLRLAGLTAQGFALPQYFRQLATLVPCFALWSSPSLAQFSATTTAVDPTAGSQLLAKFVVDGLLYVVASAAAVCFFWGIFRLFSRPLEGILEVAIGLIVFGLIGHVLGWDSGLTGVTVG